MSYPLTKTLFLVCLALLVCACGQEGPLYLPGDPSEIKTEVPRQEPGIGEEEEEDEEEQERP